MLRRKILLIPQTIRYGKFFSPRNANLNFTYQAKFLFSQKKNKDDEIKKTMKGKKKQPFSIIS